MIKNIIHFSVQNKLIVFVFTFILVVVGVQAMRNIPLDAVPDVTNNQVQVVTVSPNLAAQEVEKYITYPLEMAMQGLANKTEVRSISRFGLSVITIVLEDDVPTLEARQLVKEQVDIIAPSISSYGKPELMPITTGLGEIFQYVLKPKKGYENKYSPTELRSIQDWIIKKQLAGTKGITEISSFGGYLKQYEIAVQTNLLAANDVTITEVVNALEQNNENTGGSYIEKEHEAYYIRSEGTIKNLEDIENIVISNRKNTPILIRDIAEVRLGQAKRFGAMTMDSKGEVVGAITLMLRGANSYETVGNVKKAIAKIEKTLPEGLEIYPYLDRSHLINKAISTIQKNLLEGGIIVVIVLVLLLGNLRAGLIVASVIPLSMLFAFILMDIFGVSANLMSLGAIDFGIIIDGAVIVIEGVVHHLFIHKAGKKLKQHEMDIEVATTASQIYGSAAFGIFIILIVFVPILSLVGVEGKMFRPMALTVGFALIGAFILSMTYIPVMASLFLSKNIASTPSWIDKIMLRLQNGYSNLVSSILKIPYLIVGISIVVFGVSTFAFTRLGQEFMPTLEEGDFAVEMVLQPGSSLSETIKTATKAEKILKANFPEVLHVVSKLGSAEVPTDPMPIEAGDVMVILKDKKDWTSASNTQDLMDTMHTKLEAIVGASFEFSQPIQMRFNELMTGAKTDIAIKVYGDDETLLKDIADTIAILIKNIDGVGSTIVERTEGLHQQSIHLDRTKLAMYGLNVSEVNKTIQSAYAGAFTGIVLEGSARYDVVVKIDPSTVQEVELDHIKIKTPNGIIVPLSELSTVITNEATAQFSHEDANRKIDVGINVRNRDIGSLVKDIQTTLDKKLKLPTGYYLKYGGTFENLEAAKERLSIAVPFALLLIVLLLYFTFRQVRLALLIFTAVPLATIGGVAALYLRSMPFSISAGIGFIALFGVAVLNGIVLMQAYQELKKQGILSLKQIIIEGSGSRIRPVLMTALVAALGFIPMALSTDGAAAVQRPLATVVIGGLISSTLLTILVLPVLYFITEKKAWKGIVVLGIFIFSMGNNNLSAQILTLQEAQNKVIGTNFNLKNTLLQKQSHDIAATTKWQPGKLGINYNIGQINYVGIDHQVEALLPLGNIYTYKSLQEVERSKARYTEAIYWKQKKEAIYQVQGLYLQWQYDYQQISILEANIKKWQEYVTIIEKQIKAGETEILKKRLIDNQLQQWELDIELQKNKSENSKQILLEYLQESKTAYTPDPLSNSIISTTKNLDDTLYLAYNKQIEVLDKELNYLQKQQKPEWTVGLFTQTLNGIPTYSGLKLGINIPIRNQTSIPAKQAAIQKEMISNEVQQMQKQAAIQLKKIQQQQSTIEKSRTTLQKVVKDTEKLLLTANKQLQANDMSYYEYYSLLQSLTEMQKKDLDLLYQWQQYHYLYLYLTN